jgi:hypothetical protein
MMSVPDPGGYGTMKRTDLLGQDCARAGWAEAVNAKARLQTQKRTQREENNDVMKLLQING